MARLGRPGNLREAGQRLPGPFRVPRARRHRRSAAPRAGCLRPDDGSSGDEYIAADVAVIAGDRFCRQPGDFPQNVAREGLLYTALTRANRELVVVWHGSLRQAPTSRPRLTWSADPLDRRSVLGRATTNLYCDRKQQGPSSD